MAFGVQARDLSRVDALLDVPRAVQDKRLTVTPDVVRRVTRDEQLGIPTFVTLDPQRQTASAPLIKSGQDAVSAARAEFKSVASLYGVSDQELDSAPASVQQTLPGGAKLVRFTHRHEGLAVFREHATVLLNAQSRATSIGGYLGSTQVAKTTKSASATPLSAAEAAAIALHDFDFPEGVATQLSEPSPPPESVPESYRWLSLPKGVLGAQGALLESLRYRPVWFRLPDGLVKAFYLEVRVSEAGEENAYSYVIASADGRMLFRNNQIAHEAPQEETAPVRPAAAFAYSVWADPATGTPYPGPQGLDLNPYPQAEPNGYAMRLSPPSRVEWASAPFSKNDPWVDEDLNPRARFTYGNNARVYADLQSPKGYGGAPLPDFLTCPPDAGGSANADFYACTTAYSFGHGYDFAAGATQSRAQAASSVVSLFYLVNWLHDRFYDAGFDELSGNAQSSNYERGGKDGDPIQAQVLQFGRFNNASMETPADGASPVMRAFAYNFGSPTRSAALDNTVIAHEWGHYLSNRLIGDANGLTSKQAAGLGEGWGDFVAQLATVHEQDRLKPGNEQYQGAYAQAAYANAAQAAPARDGGNTAYFGSRRYPYSTDMRKNPLTFKHIQNGEPLPDDVPRNPALSGSLNPMLLENSELHNTGEVWASMLWECYAGILNTRPFAEAQQNMMRYLVAGMKLTPVLPTLLEARDALLAAVAASDSQDYASCLAGFAKRGAGLDAIGPDRLTMTNQGVVESYSVGPLVVIDSMELSMSDPQARSCDGDTVLDNTETAALVVNLVNRGNTEVRDMNIALSASDPHVSFPNGAVQPIHSPLLPGQRLPVAVPVYLTGMEGYGRARIDAQLGAVDPLVQVRGSSMEAWLNADIQANNSLTDAVNVWPGGMEMGGSWGIGGEADEHWYQLAVSNGRDVVSMSTPELEVSRSEDLVITFDHEYDFGAATSNGGQLFVASAYVNESPLQQGVVPYSGQVPLGSGLSSSNSALRGQSAFVGRSNGWVRNVSVHLGRKYAGQTLRIGWRAGTAPGANPDAAQFWRVDNIRVSGVTNKPFTSIQPNQKTCTSLLAQAGSSQSAAPGAAFSEPLVVQLADVSGQPMAREGVAVRFAMATAPEDGSPVAAGRFDTGAQASAVTDAQGRAQSPRLLANHLSGDYVVIASLEQGGQVGFALSNQEPGQAAVTPLVLQAHALAAGDGSIAQTAPASQAAGAAAATASGATAIPTLSQWGLMVLVLLLGALGARQVSQRATDRRP